MSLSETHLEQSLKEYNELVSKLEQRGNKSELVDALIHRSMVLMLLDSFVSAITDLEDALELCEELENEGKTVSPGTLMKIYENRGQMLFDADDEGMFSDYAKIAELMKTVGNETKHYGRKDMIRMCIDCGEDLIDKEQFKQVIPFVEKAIEVIGDEKDKWSLNSLVNVYNMGGQAYLEMEDYAGAIDYLEKSETICENLGDDLEDKMEFVFSLIYIGDVYSVSGNDAKMIEYHENAIKMLENLDSEGRLDDVELLVNLHQEIASKLMNAGKIKEAEMHLIKVMELGYPVVNEAIDELGIKKK